MTIATCKQDQFTAFVSRALLPLAGLLGLSTAGAVFSAPCSGYDVIVPISASTMEVAKDHKMTVLRSHGIVITEDPKSRYNQMFGECAGTLITLPDGKSTGQGHCARKDPEGNSYSLEWAIAAGAEKGTWKFISGTGKFAGVAGSGWWMFGKSVEDGSAINRWGGECN